MKIKYSFVIIIILSMSLVSSFDDEISYAGVGVINSSNSLAYNGTYTLTTYVYTSSACTVPLYSESTSNFNITDGHFVETINNSLSDFNATFYLRASISGTNLTCFKYTPAAQASIADNATDAKFLEGYLYSEIPLSGDVTGTTGATVLGADVVQNNTGIFNINVSCTNIQGGSDSNYCADSTGSDTTCSDVSCTIGDDDTISNKNVVQNNSNGVWNITVPGASDTDTVLSLNVTDFLNVSSIFGLNYSKLDMLYLDDTTIPNTDTNVTDFKITEDGDVVIFTLEQGDGTLSNFSVNFTQTGTTYTNASFDTSGIVNGAGYVSNATMNRSINCANIDGTADDVCTDTDTDTQYTNSSFNHDSITGAGTVDTSVEVLAEINHSTVNGSAFIGILCDNIVFDSGIGSAGICDGDDAAGAGSYDLNVSSDSGIGVILDSEVFAIEGAGTVSTAMSSNTLTITGSAHTTDTDSNVTLSKFQMNSSGLYHTVNIEQVTQAGDFLTNITFTFLEVDTDTDTQYTNSSFDLGQIIATLGTVNVSTDVLVNDTSVCLSDGTNCQASSDTNTNVTVSKVSVTGTSTKNISIEQDNGNIANISFTFTDIDTDTQYTNASFDTSGIVNGASYVTNATVNNSVNCANIDGSNFDVCTNPDTNTEYTNASFDTSGIVNGALYVSNASMNRSIYCGGIDGANSDLCTIEDTDTQYTNASFDTSGIVNGALYVSNATVNRSINCANIDGTADDVCTDTDTDTQYTNASFNTNAIVNGALFVSNSTMNRSVYCGDIDGADSDLCTVTGSGAEYTNLSFTLDQIPSTVTENYVLKAGASGNATPATITDDGTVVNITSDFVEVYNGSDFTQTGTATIRLQDRALVSYRGSDQSMVLRSGSGKPIKLEAGGIDGMILGSTAVSRFFNDMDIQGSLTVNETPNSTANINVRFKPQNTSDAGVRGRFQIFVDNLDDYATFGSDENDDIVSISAHTRGMVDGNLHQCHVAWYTSVVNASSADKLFQYNCLNDSDGEVTLPSFRWLQLEESYQGFSGDQSYNENGIRGEDIIFTIDIDSDNNDGSGELFKVTKNIGTSILFQVDENGNGNFTGTAFSQGLTVDNPNNNDARVDFYEAGLERWAIYNDGSFGDRLNIVETLASDSTIMTLENNGDVGIGDTNPGFNLEVVGDLAVSSTAGGDGDRFIVNTAGNVGIGTTAPNSALEVIGETNISGISGDGAGKAVCIKSDGNLGTCSDAVGGDGTCTCG